MTLCHKEPEELETVKKLSVTDRNTYDAVIAIQCLGHHKRAT